MFDNEFRQPTIQNTKSILNLSQIVLSF